MAGTEGGGIVRTAAAQAVAAELETVIDAGCGVVLHDRWVPGGGGAYIDHVVVRPCGVFVVDAMQRDGRVECRDVGRFMRSDRRLFVERRDATRLVTGTHRQVDAVRDVLGSFAVDVPIGAVLCFVGSDWGRKARSFAVDGVVITPPEHLATVLDGPEVLGPHQVDELARTLDRGLPCR